MTTKTFGDKKITIREFKKSDLKNYFKKFLIYANSFTEDDKLLTVGKVSAKDEMEFLSGVLKRQKAKTGIYLFAEHDGRIIGSADIDLFEGRGNHVGDFGIKIVEGYRGMGLGKFLMAEVMRLANKQLKPAPKIIFLQAFANNKSAIGLYQKMGFKIVAKIPKMREYKGKLVDEIVMQKIIKK
ncbi:MAG: GNAT family N-acetyltransferase [Candidatus Staskawiczbacteria bacterium]|jgi:ribosomal protein S18 acetylase RimI-like enzyme